MPGLNSILSLISTFNTVEKNLNDGVYVRKSLEDHKAQVIKANVDQLYEYGVNRLGVRIDSYAPYAPYTVFLKKQRGQPYDRVTLRDTGAFHKSFEIVFEPAEFYITASDPKTQELVDKYGANIFGLTRENINEIAHLYVEPDTLNQMRKEIFK